MIDFDDAAALVLGLAQPLEAEDALLVDACGRVLAAPVTAFADAPWRAVSAMDGYAVRDADLAVLPARLPIVDTIYAGRADPAPLLPGTCARIFTGAPTPEGADRVVVQEQVTQDDGHAVFSTAPGKGRHVRERGSDFRAGDVLLKAGATLTPQAMVAAASADQDRVNVVRRPRLMVVGTGDELAEPGLARQTPGAIPESVSFGVMALARQWGAEVVGRRRAPDDPAALEAVAAQALSLADVVVVTGGASVGERDHARAMFGPSGLDLVFSKVAIKPGKPVWIGRAGGRLVVGLPGNPTSALVTARLFLAPLLHGLAGGEPRTALAWAWAELAGDVPATGERETFLRGRRLADGRVMPASNQDSGAQKTLADSDVLIRRRAGDSGAGAGERVEVLAL